MIKTLYDTGDTNLINADVDGSIYSLISDDCIIDREDNFALNNVGLNCHFTANCIANIGGGFFHVKTQQSFTLPASTNNIHLCLRINPQATGDKGTIEFLTQYNMQKGNVYEGETRDLLLYVISTSASSVISKQDRRVIKSRAGTKVGDYSLWSGTQAQYDALTKDNNTLYFIEE